MDAMTADVDATTQHVDTRWEKTLVVVGLVLLAANLRPAATSIGPLLEEVREGLGMSASLAGVLATVPVLCFAAFGMLGPAMARRVGIHRTVFLSVCLMLIGLLWRATASSVPLFLLASALALAGMAASNVLLPALVKRHFPTRIARMTAVYSVALIAGAALPTVTAVPIAHVGGSWRWGLGVWGMLAVLALLPWALLLRHDVRGEAASHARIAWSALLRSRLAWAMAGFFAVQSATAYSQFGWLPAIYLDAGLTPGLAALMLGVVVVVSLPVPLVLPTLTARLPSQAPVVVVLGLVTSLGWLGILLAGDTLPWLWAALLGLGSGAFPWVLAILGLRTATAAGTVVLSGFVQSVGYLLAGIGPVLTGLLFDLTGGWTIPLIVLASLGVPMIALGLTFARPRLLEDEIRVTAASG
jgi:CP family cyanate transporter-like MFS transporter